MSEAPRGNEAAEVLVHREGAAGVIRLNRPKALNALTLPMVRLIDEALTAFEGEPGITVVILEGEGERAFCAGGDIRAIHAAGRTDPGGPAAFWAEEYELNDRLATYGKPIVVLMRGIVMGGGAGLSIHASHRVASDDIRFAMPEVGIGFVPDVGATYRLARAPGGTGRYLAYTGATVGAGDVVAAGLADVTVPAARLPELRDALVAGETPDAVLKRYAGDVPVGHYSANRELIDRAFAGSVEDALKALEEDGSDFATETHKLIRSRSPSSLRLTETLLEGATSASLRDCLVREWVGALRTLAGEDFYEGVRAAVIDKDRNPRWQPARLEDAPKVALAEFIPPAGHVPPFAEAADQEGDTR